MEFIKFGAAIEALREAGIDHAIENDHLALIPVPDDHPEEVCYMHLADPSAGEVVPWNSARVLACPRESQADAVESMIGSLHLSQILLLPVGKWRSVFDAVAFSMAANEDWQAIDQMATVELNTRDPLLAEPADYHTIHALIQALFNDAVAPDQGIIITSTATPFIVEVVPAGALRVMVGSQVLADEVMESLPGVG
ncbi:MAG: hypothetical protein ACR2GY_02350 [Phycisphaerales bacterium]